MAFFKKKNTRKNALLLLQPACYFIAHISTTNHSQNEKNKFQEKEKRKPWFFFLFLGFFFIGNWYRHPIKVSVRPVTTSLSVVVSQKGGKLLKWKNSLKKIFWRMAGVKAFQLWWKGCLHKFPFCTFYKILRLCWYEKWGVLRLVRASRLVKYGRSCVVLAMTNWVGRVKYFHCYVEWTN